MAVARSVIEAHPGDEYRVPVRADGYRDCPVARIPADPEPGAVGGIVGDGDEGKVVPLGTLTRDEHGAAARADGDRCRGVEAVARPAVAAHPSPGARSGVVGDRGVVRRQIRACAAAGDEHRAPVRADRHRSGEVLVIAWAVVALHPQNGSRSAGSACRRARGQHRGTQPGGKRHARNGPDQPREAPGRGPRSRHFITVSPASRGRCRCRCVRRSFPACLLSTPRSIRAPPPLR